MVSVVLERAAEGGGGVAPQNRMDSCFLFQAGPLVSSHPVKNTGCLRQTLSNWCVYECVCSKGFTPLCYSHTRCTQEDVSFSSIIVLALVQT